MDINLHYTIDGDVPVVLIRPVDLFFQEVELAIKIFEYSIWNRPKGLDIRKYVFNKYVSVYMMETEIKNFITQECDNASNFDWDLSVYILNVEETKASSEVIVIEMKIDFNGETITNKFLIN